MCVWMLVMERFRLRVRLQVGVSASASASASASVSVHVRGCDCVRLTTSVSVGSGPRIGGCNGQLCCTLTQVVVHYHMLRLGTMRLSRWLILRLTLVCHAADMQMARIIT